MREELLLALRSLAAQRTRALLGLLGIIIGTSSLLLLAGLIRGGEDALQGAQQNASESDLIVVRKSDTPAEQKQRTTRPLSRADARSLAGSPALAGAWVGSEQSRTTWANARGARKRVNVVSARPDTLDLYRLSLAQGRFIDAEDLRERRRACVVGHEVWLELLQGDAVRGQRLTIDGDVWSVVGVLAPKPSLSGKLDTNVWNRKVLLPETAYDLAYNSERAAKQLLVRPAVPGLKTPLDTLRAITVASLLRLHYGVKNFTLEPRKGQEQERLIAGVLYVLLFGTVAVSLLVGGINIMNVMLVSVTERTREIGIRRALGAAPRVIRRQFLLEAALLTSVGGVAGVLTGAGLCWCTVLVIRQFFGAFPLYIELWAVVAGVGSSVLTGVAFGLYPALRAARLDVVEALRQE